MWRWSACAPTRADHLAPSSCAEALSWRKAGTRSPQPTIRPPTPKWSPSDVPVQNSLLSTCRTVTSMRAASLVRCVSAPSTARDFAPFITRTRVRMRLPLVSTTNSSIAKCRSLQQHASFRACICVRRARTFRLWNGPQSLGADIIMQHIDSPAAVQVAAARGALAFGQDSDMIKFDPKTQLTSIIDNWTPYYDERVRAELAGKWISTDIWGGLKSKLVVMAPYTNMPDDVKKMAEATEATIVAGTLHPFKCPVVAQD